VFHVIVVKMVLKKIPTAILKLENVIAMTTTEDLPVKNVPLDIMIIQPANHACVPVKNVLLDIMIIQPANHACVTKTEVLTIPYVMSKLANAHVKPN